MVIPHLFPRLEASKQQQGVNVLWALASGLQKAFEDLRPMACDGLNAGILPNIVSWAFMCTSK